VSVIGFGLEADGRALSAQLLMLLSGVVLFASGSAVLEVMLNSRRHFTVTALRNAVAPCVVIVVMLVTWENERAPYWIAGAFTAGYGLYFLMLAVSAFRRLGFGPGSMRWPTGRTLALLRSTVSYPLSGFGIRQLARVAERSIASMGQEGSVAAYYYAYRLLAAIQNIVGVSVALTGQPKLTEHDLAGERSHFIQTLRKRIGLILVISAPAAVALMLLSRPIIELLYSRKGMDSAGLDASASVLFILGPAVIFYCLTPVLNSALYAQKRYRAVLYNMCLAAGSNVLLAFVLFKWLGLTGVAWAATIAAVLSVMDLLWLNSRPTRSHTHPTTT